MHNLCIPGPVVVLVRRLVHVISTISIAQQCRNLEGNRVDHTPSILEHPQAGEPSRASDTLNNDGCIGVFRNLVIRWALLSQGGGLNALWSHVGLLEQDRQLNRAIGLSLPWFGSRWQLSSRNSTMAPEATLPRSARDEQYPTPDTNYSEQAPQENKPGEQQEKDKNVSDDIIHRLMNNPTLYDPIRAPRFPIVLCHGLYGFDVRGPSTFPFLQKHYWSNILSILRKKVGAEVIVTSVPSTGSIASRSAKLHDFLQDRAQGRGINFIGHSMGGLDCRHLISHIQPFDYTPLSLTTVGTPHRGSPFMDWCQDNIGLGKMDVKHPLDNKALNEVSNNPLNAARSSFVDFSSSSSKVFKPSLSFASLPSSFTTLLLSVLDSPAYANLTTKYLNEVFNPATPDAPGVKYFSVAGRIDGVSIWHPLWLPKMVLDGVESRDKAAPGSTSYLEDRGWGNDCLVSVDSAKWGEFLGVLEGCDHWEMRGPRGLDLGVDFSSVSMPLFARPTPKRGDQVNESWSLKDWAKFVRVWKSEEDKAVAAASVARGSPRPHVPSDALEVGDRDRENALKSSTDKVSAMFDWIVEQVPSASSQADSAVEKERLKRRDLATKEGLDRLYVALSRKLYDEGL